MSKEFDYPRDFKGIWIPKEIWLDNDLNAIEKIIFSEIDSLDVDGSDGCYASNEYLANFCKCSITKVSTSISRLIELGYVKVVKTDGRKRWLKTSLSKFERQTNENEKSEVQEMKESNISSNKDDKNIDKNSVKYALEDEKQSSKGNIYASVPEEREEHTPQKQNRYIPQDYTEEQLIKHIKQPICDYMKKEYGGMASEEMSSELIKIIMSFHREYEGQYGKRHRVLSDKAYENIVDRYMNPPEEMTDDYSIETYEAMMERYFEVDYNKRGKYKCNITLGLSHFMSDNVRNNLYCQTCK